MPEAVGIFWFVGDELIAVVCDLTNAVPYGDCLTYDGGHAEHWEAWQKAGASSLRSSGLPERIATSEYEEHPRGRIVKEPDVAPNFYPVVSSFPAVLVSSFAGCATGAGAEPMLRRSVGARRGWKVAAKAAGVLQPSAEWGRVVL